jgi:hypothetical protein
LEARLEKSHHAHPREAGRNEELKKYNDKFMDKEHGRS